MDRITVNPKQCGGRPCVRGMRIRVADVLELLASGMTPKQILKERWLRDRAGREADSIYFTVEPGESDLPYVVDKLGEGCLMFASDFPHENNLEKVKDDIREFEGLKGISDEAKSGILAKNAESFYQIT